MDQQHSPADDDTELRGHPADLPLLRQDLLEEIQRLRAAATSPTHLQTVIDDYRHYTALDRP